MSAAVERAAAPLAGLHARCAVSDEAHDLDAALFQRGVAGASTLGLALAIVSTAWLSGWMGATIAVGQGVLWCLYVLLRRPSRWLRNLVIVGLVAGFVELVADAWLVHSTGTLTYAPGGPFLAASPAYMPFAWLGMLCTGMALAMRLRTRCWSALAATLGVSAALGLYIPVYEALAAWAGWWEYRDCAAFWGTVPVYIVVGEMLLALPLVAITARTRRMSHARAVLVGVALGLWIFLSYVIAHALVTLAEPTLRWTPGVATVSRTVYTLGT